MEAVTGHRARSFLYCGWVLFGKTRCERPGARARCILDTKAKLKHASSPESYRDPREQQVDTGGRPGCGGRRGSDARSARPRAHVGQPHGEEKWKGWIFLMFRCFIEATLKHSLGSGDPGSFLQRLRANTIDDSRTKRLWGIRLGAKA
jgi:hypothetical protein